MLLNFYACFYIETRTIFSDFIICDFFQIDHNYNKYIVERLSMVVLIFYT